MPLQRLNPEYVPAAGDLPLRVFTLPEVRYRPALNVAEVLLDGARAAGWSDRPAFIYEGRTLSYGDVARDVDRLGAAFTALGIGPGDRVLIRLHDQPELVITILALVKMGAIAVPTYPLLRAPDLVYREHDTEATALVVGADLLEEAEKARPSFRHVVHRIAVGDAPDGYRSYAALLAQGRGKLAAAATRADDIATLIYTSGSTGQPKGVLHSHSDILAAADTYCRFCIRPEADDVLCGPPPIPFSAGLGYFLIFPLRFGAAAILTRDKAPHGMLDAIARHGGTILFAMPTYYNMILKSEGAGVGARVRALRQTLVAGEPVAPELTEQWQARTGHPLAQLLGTTEMFHVFLSPRRGIDEIRPTSMGRAVPGYQVVVRDADSFAEVERGEAGLLTVIGPTGTKYWRKPDEQRRAVRQGWNVCQDLVRMDEDGYLYHLARTDDLIVSAGYNISPVEVESVLLKHPGVGEVAVVGAPDPGGVRSRIVKAFVVVRASHTPGPALARELQQFFREHGTPYMYPREIEFLDELPKTVTGKIRRADLRRSTS